MAGPKDPNKRPVIIKKVKKVSGGGHHGGAWKVAYADFVTAMMAFFLLLWLIAQVPKEKLQGIAEYFTPTVGVKNLVGRDENGASGDIAVGVKTEAASAPSVVFGAPPTTGDVVKAPETDIVQDSEYYDQRVGELKVTQQTAEAIAAELEKKDFEKVESELKQAIEKNPELREFKDNLQIKQTQEGLQIEITDLEGISMFERGSTTLSVDVQPLLAKVADVVRKTDNKIAIVGHTDSVGYSGVRDYSNWELSADRANASRRFLTQTGLDEKRIFRVEGKADKDQFDPTNPEAPRNRRISIILLKKSIAPVNGKDTD
jgi:chemotaxis protein MotB